MNKYKLVVYEDNGGVTRLMMFKNSFAYWCSDKSGVSGFFLDYDGKLWMTEPFLKSSLGHECPDNYQVLDEWQQLD
jgi:hypothetical protein